MILNYRTRLAVLAVIVSILTLSIISACGKKDNVQPPEGEKTDFPRKYPSY